MAVVDHPESFSLRPPTLDDPWRWLQAGWHDTWRLSLGYGCAFVAGGLALTGALWASGLAL